MSKQAKEIRKLKKRVEALELFVFGTYDITGDNIKLTAPLKSTLKSWLMAAETAKGHELEITVTPFKAVKTDSGDQS